MRREVPQYPSGVAAAQPRSILHVDMDAFFASVEQLDAPELRGRPVLVGHDGPRGVVAAASYEARAFGCRSAQPISVAKRLCPHALIVPTRFSRYSEASAQVFEIFERFTPQVEPLSVDEAFLDVTASLKLLGAAETIARDLKAQVHRRTGLTASVGVAPNKFLAKLASDLSKPDGLKVIMPDDVDHLLPPLPAERIWGIGPRTAERLHAAGVRTIGDLRRQAPRWFEDFFGADGTRVLDLCFGRDDRPVLGDEQAKRIGHEQTFEQDLPDPEHVRSVLLGQCEQVARRLRRRGLRAGAVTLKIRFGDFQTITRSRSLNAPTDETQSVWLAARGLFDTWAATSFRPVRLIGVSAGGLTSGEGQLELFTDPQAQRRRRLDAAMDSISHRFGNAAIRRGGEGPS